MTLPLQQKKHVEQQIIDRLISFYQQGRLTDCEALARQTLAIFPNHGFSWKLLGATLTEHGHLDEAISAMEKATELLPEDHETLNNLGVTLTKNGALLESESIFRKALKLNDNFAEVHNNLGVTLLNMRRLSEAEEYFRKAISIHPAYIEAYCNLATTLQEKRNFKDSEYFFKHALELNPSHADGYNNLGNLYQRINRLLEAEKVLRKAIELKPDFAKAYNNLGIVLQAQGNVEESEQCFQKALQYKPDYSDAFDGLLSVVNYHADKPAEEIFTLYQDYDKQFGIPNHKYWEPHQNNRHPDRRLKIAYVSPAFYKHPVLNFIEPILINHNRNKFDIYAYAEIVREDQDTLRCKQLVDHWVPTIGMSDEDLCNKIRSDQIDILVDIAGHTSNNRLGVFARKPAPISLHWLDFGYTTGLSAINYYLTDIHTGPIGSETLFSEQLWRLPVPPFTYRPTNGMGQVNPLPAKNRGFITFGTLTRAIRLNDHTIRAWATILHQVPRSRLVVDSNNFKENAMQQALKSKFFVYGIESHRLDIGYHSPPWDTLRGIDIGLDCFPHNSGTTLFENLYMGIPFITYNHRPAVGKIGSSILEGIGRHEWIAYSEKEYIEKTVALASDISRLTSIRAGLREELIKSPLMDEQGFTAAIEVAYVKMFSKWISTNQSATNQHPVLSQEAAVLYNRGISLQQNDQTKDAQTAYIQAINIQPDFVEAYNNLGVVFQQMGQFEDSEQCLQAAVKLHPEYADAWFNLGNTKTFQHDLFQAEEIYRKVISIQPNYTNAYYKLGHILQEQGRPQEAEIALKQALALQPDHMEAFSTWLFTVNYNPDKSSEEVFDTYKEFNKRFCEPLHNNWEPHRNNRDSNRTLRIGYVAPGFKKHPARFFLKPLLENHNKNSFEIFAFIDTLEENASTDLFTPYADHWIPTKNVSDAEMSKIIRSHEIDVLIDLSGHTAGNRLQVFAMRPAPVSLHWLDFGYTTGLTAIDYYLTDSTTAPHEYQDYFSEKIWPIRTPALAYRPPRHTGEVNTLPALENKYITFGTLTRAIRINHRTIRVWSEILKQRPDSRLIINSGSFVETAMQKSMEDKFMAHGIDKSRLDIGCESPPWNVYRSIDIMLDCFPHNSGTTLIESLYMGGAYVTLADRPSMGRLGGAILESVGHPEWIASTEEEYINIAVSLASDIPALAHIRNNLRQEMENSPLMAEKDFTLSMETAYREMFEKWTNKENRAEDNSATELIAQCMQQAQLCIQANLFSEAQELCLSVITVAPQNPEANFHLGQLFLAQQDALSALPYLETAVNLHPEESTYWLAYIDAMDQSGQHDTACQLLDMAMDAGLEGDETNLLKNRLSMEQGVQ